MLLLTAATFGGQESIGIFDHLPDDEAELLKDRAEGIAKIPREKRVPLLVQEIKRQVTARRGQLWSADPERLAHVLRGERAALVEVILRALPQGTADAVRKLLPRLQPVKLQHEVRPQILNIVRWRLEEALVRAGPRRAGFKFSDVLLLKSREVLTLCDRLGARALAQAIAGLAEADRDGLLSRLKPDQRQLAAKHASAAAARALTALDAKQLLGIYGAEKDPSLALTSAGAQRLARAALAQSPEFAARLVERHPGPLGQLLLKWIREERPRVTGRIDGGRTDVVGELEQLERLGIIDKPIRLAPPPARIPAPPPRAPPGPPDLPGGKLVPPRPRGLMTAPPDTSGAPYRDPIAERQARRAGALSSRLPPSEPQAPTGADRSPGHAIRGPDPGGAPRRDRLSSRGIQVPESESGRAERRDRLSSRGIPVPESESGRVERRDRLSSRGNPVPGSESGGAERRDRLSSRGNPVPGSESGGAERRDRMSSRGNSVPGSESGGAERRDRLSSRGILVPGSESGRAELRDRTFSRAQAPASVDPSRPSRSVPVPERSSPSGTPAPDASGRERPRSPVLQPIPKRVTGRPDADSAHEHRPVGSDAANRRSEPDERDENPPTSPGRSPQAPDGERTSLQRSPRPGRGPKGGSG
ncbi:MAG: hypothetical protein IRZ16_17835 [Myxococcaceae bacterium]|nr:hypothetical protein [Myxococcaceae bacterium]